ncbi:MAG: arginine deiminase family protein [Saprospiraceae bacterium]|jgi:arginine deiminase
MAFPVQVSSEIAPLRQVIVHCPDKGISRISPKHSDELLFDDIVYLPQMQEEHRVFTRVLSAFLGAENVLDVSDLLREALDADPVRRSELIERICDYEELPQSARRFLEALPNTALAGVLIEGDYEPEDYVFFDPIPNFIFTRDIAVTVNEHVIITKAAKEARYRENYLSQFIFSTHPRFVALQQHKRLINMNDTNRFPPSRRGEHVSVEGGDMMMIHPDYLLIGCSERSSRHGIQSLTQALFEQDVVNQVVQVNIPSDRSFMHIDTIFTQIDHKHLVCYKPLVVDGISSTVEVLRKNGSVQHYASVKAFFQEEINPDMEFIYSGKGISPYQEREQWTDGCNLLTIKPGVALTYDRNPKTEEAFREAGYQITHALDLLTALDRGVIRPEQVEQTIITLPSGELSRARGGSHCMSCPIWRSPV